MDRGHPVRPLAWMGRSREDISAFPAPVRLKFGYALYLAQSGDKHESAKPLRGFGGAGVLEIVSDHDGDTFRAVYTVRFAKRVYVLHAFQKRSKSGIATPRKEMDLIMARLRRAREEHEQWINQPGNNR